jgi:hypothetical protein
MNPWLLTFLISCYPLIVIFALNRVAFRWGAKYHGTVKMPSDVFAIADRHGRLILLLDLVVLGAFTYVISRGYPKLSPPFMGKQQSWPLLIGLGIVTGVVLAILRYTISIWISRKIPPRLQPAYVRGNLCLWLIIFVCGAIAEETWRAFCLCGLLDAQWSVASAILVTSTAYAVACMSGFAYRISDGVVSVLLAMAFGAMLSLTFFVSDSWLIPCVANFVANVLDMVMRRHHIMTRLQVIS